MTSTECPACDIDRVDIVFVKNKWIECEHCKTWYHFSCVNQDPSLSIDQINHWYCKPCIDKSNGYLEISLKPTARKSSRKKSIINYQNLDEGIASDPDRWIKVIQSKVIYNGLEEFTPVVNPEDLDENWLYNTDSSMTEPVIIKKSQGLDMQMPSSDLNIKDVAKIVGPDTPLEVIDVASQSDLVNWTLGRWADYWYDPTRNHVRNVISLEVSESPLGQMMDPPRFVRCLDWLESIWPKHRREQGEYPKVQKYCLMSVSRSWTDWHVDFSASSVYYHILRGSKTFYFIRPTMANLKRYQAWSGSSERQEHTWLGDDVDKVYEVKLEQGNTMIIPSGWIHAVYTPNDSLVLGGNFLHSLNIPMQLKVYGIELATKVPKKFRFPYFINLLWYVANNHVNRLKDIIEQRNKCQGQTQNELQKSISAIDIPTDLPPRVLRGLANLSVFLLEQVRRLNNTPLPHEEYTKERRRVAKENVPWETIDDPALVTRRLRIYSMKALGIFVAKDMVREREQAIASMKPEMDEEENDDNVQSLKRKRSLSPSPLTPLSS